MLGMPAEAEIDVLNDDNAEHYLERSDQFDMALDLTAGRRGLAALGDGDRALGRASAGGRGRGRAADRDCATSKFTWYVGLDAEGTRIGDALWNGEELDEAAQARVVGLFRLTFRDPGRRAGQGRRASRSI